MQDLKPVYDRDEGSGRSSVMVNHDWFLLWVREIRRPFDIGGAESRDMGGSSLRGYFHDSKTPAQRS
jgi:hypothetical protein